MIPRIVIWLWLRPIALMHSSAGPAEKMATQQSQQMMADRERELGINDQTLSQFSGPADQTPFYRSLVQSGRQSTAQAYNGAKQAVRANAHAAGYGYEQPVAQGADEGVERAEASDIANVPRYALNDTANMEMQAAGIRSGEVSASNPSSLTSTAVSAEEQRRSALMQALLGAGKLATGFIPHPKGSSGSTT